MPKVSVIIPVYNVEKYLRQALGSVVNQTLKDIEIICIDDGSTDGSLKILKEYASKDCRIKVITQENKGAGAARNMGLDNATGNHIAFVDPDDWIEEDFIEKLYNKICTDDADICISGYKGYDEATDTLTFCTTDMYKKRTSSVCTYKEIKNAIFARFSPCIKLYKKELIVKNNIRFPEDVCFEDVIFSIQCIILSGSITFWDECLYIYRENRNNSLMNSAKRDLRVLDTFKFIKAVYDFLVNVNVFGELEYEYYRFVLWQILYHRSRINNKECLDIYINAYKSYLSEINIEKILEKYPDLQGVYRKTMPKISVIIPVYNVEKYLRKALNSVVNQTFKDIEIICIDDCSTDGSLKILREYSKKYINIRLFEQEENKGVGAARNFGIDNATSEYIMFLDPDDWYELDACELCYNQISKNGNDLVIFGHNRYTESTGEYQYNNRNMISPFDKYLNTSNINLDEVDTNFIACCYSVCLVYKKEFLNKNNIRFKNYRMFEDQPFFINAFINAKSVSIIDKALYYYRIRKSSATFVYNNQYDDILNAKKDVLKILNNSQITGNRKIAVYVHTILSVIYWLNFYMKIFATNKKLLYTNIRKILFLLDRNYIETEVKERLSQSTYKQYKKILEQSCFEYKNKQIFKKIFSISNSEYHKTVTLCGIKFKFRRDISPINFRFFSYLTAWIFPLKEDRIQYRKLCLDIDERRHILNAHKNYPKIIKRIKNKKGPVRVLFLVNEIAKWKAQTLYDLLHSDKNFEPIVCLIGPPLNLKNTKIQKKEIIKQNRKIFEAKNMNYVIAYDTENDRPINLRKFKPDIVFYQQPWGLEMLQSPNHVSKYALTYYINYFVDNYSVLSEYNQDFHKYLFRHYVLNKQWESEYKKEFNRDNIVGLGHTMLDNIYLNKGKEANNNYVIYAPHWSFNHKKNPNVENYGTFLKNRYEILEFAKKHPEYSWVFKPHPRLEYALADIGETKEQIKSYWDEWRKIGQVCEDSDYMELFLNSKALITDCGSFLTEYFCTGKPLIHLISSDCMVEPNWIAKKIFDTFYKVNNLDEMYETFEKVIIQGIDDKKDLRLRVLKESGLSNNYAAKNILDDISVAIYGKKVVSNETGNNIRNI